MKKIEFYTTDYCPYCLKAKSLLDRKGLTYEEIDVTGDDEARTTLVERSNGMRTVPQIFIDGIHIGGCDDLYELDRSGKLDDMVR